MAEHNNKAEVADILRAGMDVCRQRYGSLPQEYYKTINSLIACRTDKMKGHVNRCDHCSHEEQSYNSCRNRHCPKCQRKASLEWVQARVEELLPVPYFHAVFTLPHKLNPVALRNRETAYNLLFRSVSETLTELASNKKHLGAEIGFFCVLHTWGQNLLDHLHLHCVIPAGGLANERKKWKHSRKEFLFPIPVVQELFRGKFLFYFKEAVKKGEILFHGKTKYLADDKSYRDFLSTLYHKDWVVYLKEPFAGPEKAIEYLSRYTHRIAISNRRIVSMENGKVAFRWKDNRDKKKWKVMNVDVVEFVRRFLLHFLPKGFMRIRYFGMMANRNRKKVLDMCRKLLDTAFRSIQKRITSALQGFKTFAPRRCPICKQGVLVASFASPAMPPG